MNNAVYNPFVEEKGRNDDDIRCINAALSGDQGALERLILRHQAWIYNIALKMVMDPDDASDVTQEILIKIITRLSSYDPAKGSFRTWLYRIVKNHVITMKQKPHEKRLSSSMDEFFSYIMEIPDDRTFNHPEYHMLLEESKINCMGGMLLCFNRTERMAFILGDIFNVTDAVGSEIMEVSRSNFRKILSRSRKKLFHYMNEYCGFMNDGNPCKCEHKWRVLIERGVINPDNLKYCNTTAKPISTVIENKMNDFMNIYHEQFLKLFREQPFYDAPDIHRFIKTIVQRDDFKRIFNFI